jgi:uracil-DNA glycosylase family 4
MNAEKEPLKHAFEQFAKEITECRKCPRLVAWRESVAAKPPRRFQGQSYWAKPVTGFGDIEAKLLIIGLAPAAHGGNRTGRIFTGDRSGDWLFRALYKAGFASQPQSISRNDGMRLRDCYVSAVARCAPPENKLSPEEIANCKPFLVREVELLWPHLRCVVVLGRVAFDWWLRHLKEKGIITSRGAYAFAHGAEFSISRAPRLLCSFHPSQQNTLTGRLTEPMFDLIWTRAREIVDAQN